MKTAQTSKPVIGLIGGIGAGKSTVAKILESLGCCVIDSDRAAHAQLAEPEVIATLCSWWGDSICHPDGTLNRAAMAKIVFAEAAQLSRLESLLWPRIEIMRRKQMADREADPKVRAFVLDAPKLLEAGLHELCDSVIFVDADAGVREQRLKQSRNWSREELKRREEFQKPLDNKRAIADYVVSNNNQMDQLRTAVEQVFSQIVESKR